jgi:hypothetical protein
MSTLDDDNFDWSYKNRDVIVPEQRSLAIYKNNFGQAVLRVERYWDEESDPFIVIDHAQIPGVIAALRAIADEPLDRSEAPPTDGATA